MGILDTDMLSVVGPYVFGAGVISFLFSKELWLYEHQFMHFLSFWILFLFVTKKWGAQINKYFDNYGDVGTSHRHAYCNMLLPLAGSGVVRIDPLRFLVECFTRRLNQD